MRNYYSSFVNKTFIIVCAAAIALTFAVGVKAGSLPGEGISVQPVSQGYDEESFQEYIVSAGLEKLGYTVKPTLQSTVPLMHLAVAQGDADFLAMHWHTLQEKYFTKPGGDAKMSHVGHLIKGCVQGYLIDKKTAEKHAITTIDQLKDPAVARLFDSNGDGTADLAGCEPGWGCERVLEHHLDAYGLRKNVTHNQGSYPAVIADTIARYKLGKSVLYYTWAPYWVGGTLVAGEDVQWLTVPYTTLPGERTETEKDTTLAGIGNLGFAVNEQTIVANNKFLAANPAAKKLFELVEVPINDVSAQNLKMKSGEKTEADIRRHVKEWISAHQAQFDTWVAEAMKAAQ